MGTWNERFTVGIEQVDEQHKCLFDKIDDLRAAMRLGEGPSQLAPVLKFLGEYAVKHFATEEGLMRLYKYPKFDEHKKLHDDFKGDFGKLKQELAAATTLSRLSIQVEHRLSDWLVQHIRVRDKEAAAFMTGCGAR